MPGNYPLKRYKKRKYKKRRGRRKRNIARPLALSGMPKSKLVRLRYVLMASLNPGAGSKTAISISANDMFNPDSVSTRQPTGFNQLLGTSSTTGWYDHFQVVGSKITVTFVEPEANTNVNPAYVGIVLSDNGTRVSSAASISALFESSLNTRKQVQIAGRLNAPYQATLSSTFSQKKFFGTKSLGVSKYKGTYNSSPSEQAYFEVYAASIAANDPGVLNFIATVDYIALLTEPKQIVESAT